MKNSLNALDIEIESLREQLAESNRLLEEKKAKILSMIANDKTDSLVESLDDETKEMYYDLFGHETKWH